jgi:transposase-like protein
MTCPQCSSSYVRHSSTSSWKDILPGLLGREAFRCRKCQHRFLALPSKQSASKDPDRPQRKIQHDQIAQQRMRRRLFRRFVACAVVVVMFSLFGLFLHYISVDHAPKGDAQDMGSPNQ